VVSISQEVIRQGEVWLSSIDASTGGVKNSARFKVNALRPILNGLFPPTISLGDDGRDTQPFASTIAFDDFTSGIGILNYDPAIAMRRYWWGTLDARRRRAVALAPLVTDRQNPHVGVLTNSKARAGIHFGTLTYVAFDAAVYAYDQTAESWTTANGSPVFVLAASPTSDPVEWNGSIYWFTGSKIARFNGVSWSEIDNNAVAGIVFGGYLWTVDASGSVRKSSASDLSSWTLITSSVLFTDDVPNGMFIYQGGQNQTIPYIIGKRRIYAIDEDAGLIYPAGPALPPYIYPISATVYGADNFVYIGHGMSVIQWNGDTAQNVGFDVDDGVPPDIRGRIVKVLGTDRDLFALSSSFQSETDDGGQYEPTDDSFAIEASQSGPATSCLFVRRGSGWHVLSVSSPDQSEATTIFVSFYQSTYRLWFAWGSTIYSIDMPLGLSNPIEEVTGTFQPSGYIVTPWIDFGYHESKKIGLLLEIRAKFASSSEKITPWIAWDGSSTWLPVLNSDGSHGITTIGRSRFMISAAGESPPTGRAHDSVRFKLDMQRGGDASKTPILEMLSFHVLKVVDPIMGWDMEIDMSQDYNGLTPDEQWIALMNLMSDNRYGLLHFCYSDDETGSVQLRPVKVTGLSASVGTGPRTIGRVRLAVSEVISDA